MGKLKNFNENPFLKNYLPQLVFGNTDSKSIAKALIYPRLLGTSISTSFGTQLQYFCSDVLKAYASTTSGIDIEFIDAIDNKKKYCQIKSGPNTINKDDVKTIFDHFKDVKNIAKANHSNINNDNLVVGVFYGTTKEISSHYKKISEEYDVYIGQEFWYRLTGDINFYNDLIECFKEVAKEMDTVEFINEVIENLALEIEKQKMIV